MNLPPQQPTSASNNNHRAFSDMGIMEHLSELRTRLIYSIAAVVIMGFVCYSFCEWLFVWLSAPFRVAFPNDALVGTSPADALVIKIAVSFFAGAIVSLPFLFYQFWGFISPGLYEKERKWVIPFVFVTTICFVLGVMFCYYEVLPYSFGFFHEEYESIGLKPQVTLSSHLELTIQMLLGFGVVFELPVLSFILARLGLLNARMLTGAFRYIIVAIFIIAAVLSPPDVISQMLFAVPMLVLYGVSIFVVKLAQKPVEQP